MHTDAPAQPAPAHLYEVSGADFDGYPQILVSAGDFPDLHHAVAQLHPGTVNFRARRLPVDEAQRLATIRVGSADRAIDLPRDHEIEIEFSVDGDDYQFVPFPLWKVAAALGHTEGDETPIDVDALTDTHHDVTEAWARLLRLSRPAQRMHIYYAYNVH